MPEREFQEYETRLTEQRLARMAKSTRPRVVFVQGDPTELQPPGSICITVAQRGSPALTRLAEAAGAGDAATIAEIVEPIKQRLNDRPVMDASTLSDTIEATPAFADISYGDRSLIRTLFTVDDIEITRAILPYVGGGLDADAFSATEYSRDGQEGSLEVLITVHEPRIDAAVADIINGLSPSDAGMRLGISPDTVACTATATPVVVAVLVATVATAVGHCAPGWNSEEWVINPAPELEGLAPRLAVQRLVAMREQLLSLPVG